MVNKKCQAGLAAGLTVIMCVGESLEQREQGIAERVVSGQLSGGLSGLTASDLDRIIVAYEPVWAIGTGRTATPEQAQEMHAFIRRVFAERYSDQAARSAANSLRWLGQAGQHRRLDGADGHRWRAGRRREFEGREFCEDCELQEQ